MKKKSEKKEYIVIGLGRFGSSIARQLEANGCTVLAVDRNEKLINLITDYVTHAVCLDITNEESMAELGMSNFDGAIISMGHSLEAAIFATLWAKEQGVPLIIAKAYDEMQGKILKKIGADEIVFPEREMGQHLANSLAFGHMLDAVELSSDYSIADIPVQKEWIGKSLRELRLREKYHVNLIAIERNRALEITPDANTVFTEEDILVLLGSNATLKKLADRNDRFSA